MDSVPSLEANKRMPAVLRNVQWQHGDWCAIQPGAAVAFCCSGKQVFLLFLYGSDDAPPPHCRPCPPQIWRSMWTATVFVVYILLLQANVSCRAAPAALLQGLTPKDGNNHNHSADDNDNGWQSAEDPCLDNHAQYHQSHYVSACLKLLSFDCLLACLT